VWGASIVGFGSDRYRYGTGRERDRLRAGFAPRERNPFSAARHPAGIRRLHGIAGRSRPSIDRDTGVLTNGIDDVDGGSIERIAQRCWDVMAARQPG